MRNVRPRRHRFIDLRRVAIGDWIVLVAGLLTVLSLFLQWFVSNVPGTPAQNAFAYSPDFSVVVLVFFLATLGLVIYPALSPDLRLPPLPFSTPVIFLFMGMVLLLMYFFELGKYSCITCQGTSHGFGLYVGLIASFVYVVGAIIKWGSRPTRHLEV